MAQSSRSLEEVVVTAQKREQSLQDAALAVSSLSGQQLSEDGVSDLLNLQSLAPSLQVSTAAGTARVFIRGIGLTNFAMGGEPSVAVHVDSAVISRPAAQIHAFYDLERIEILRGPQGSLYGRNATGGSINVHTRRPSDQFGGYLNAGIGNLDQQQWQGAVTGPLIADQLLARLAFNTQKHDGFGTNLYDGQNLDDADSQSLRASFSYVGFDNLQAHLRLNRFEEVNTNDYHMLGPANPDVVPPEILLGGTNAADPRDNNSEVSIGGEKSIDSATLELTWDLNELATLKSVTNHLTLNRDLATDLNGTPVQFFRNDLFEDSEQVSEELHLRWQGEHHSTLFGLYYFQEDIDAQTRIQGPAPYTTVLNRPFIQFYGKQQSESYAVFANSTWPINQKLSITGGLRYSKDKKSDDGFTLIPTGTIIPAIRDTSWDAWTPSLTAEYITDNNVMLYASASKGYKAGILNIGNAGEPVDPEFITNVEAGLKSQWYENRLQINLAAFHANIEDLQVQRPINGNLVTVNAAEATTQGIELEGIALLNEGLTLAINAAYVDARFNDFITSNTTFTPDIEENLKDNPLPNAPKLQLDLSVEYELVLNNGWSGRYKIQSIFTDERWFNEFQEDIAYQESTVTLNSHFLITSPEDRWTLNFWGRNLTDEDILSHINVTSSVVGHMRAATFTQPRTYGATLGYTF